MTFALFFSGKEQMAVVLGNIRHRGVRLPGFNDELTGLAPDIGAFETGMPPLRFGREMAPGFQRAPWEVF